MLARIVIAAALLSCPAVAAAGQPPRLRVDPPQLAKLIDAGSQRSPTLRHITETLEASNVVVYVRFGTCRGHIDSCLEFVTMAAPWLYVRVTIDPFEKPEYVVVGLLAHELQHALELAGSDVTTPKQFAAFYEKHGRRGIAGYETDTAFAAGFRVEREFRTR